MKAAFLYKFAKYVTWPDAAFEDEHSPVVIGVVARDPFVTILEETVEDKTVSARPIEIKRITPPRALKEAEPDRREAVAAELRSCHLLYISSSDEKGFPRFLELLEDSPVLTVSDIHAFAREGGIVELVLNKKGTFDFRINNGVAKAAELRISAKVLNLATIVESRPKKAT